MVVVDDGQEWKVVDGARYCTGLAWRNDHLRTNRPLGICASIPAAHLVDVPQQVGRIFVDATRAGPLELVAAVATRQQADAKCASTLRSQHVPDAIAHNQGRHYSYSQSGGCGQEEIRIGLSVFHLITSNDRNTVEIDIELRQQR